MEDYSLHRAAENGDLDEIKRLIEMGEPMDRQDNCARTPLHWAAMCGHFEVAEHLLLNNCDCNRKAYDGTTAVLLAAERGRKDMVDLYLQFGADVISCDEFGRWTVLHHACDRGWTETVRSIVENKKANLDARDCVGTTPLMLAAEEGHAAIVQLLIRGGAQVNISDSDSWTALHYATKWGWLPIVKSIVDTAECDIHLKNSSGNTPLHIAYSMNNLEIVQELVKASAHRNHENTAAFFCFSMHRSVQHGDLAKLEHLIKFGASVDSRDRAGCTLLHRAAEHGQLEVAECLVKNNCNLNPKNSDGETPVLIAAERQHKGIFDLLYRSRDQDVLPDPDLLYHAAGNGWLDVVQQVIENGEWEVDAATRFYGKTLLMSAAESEQVGVATFLIKAGADVNCKDSCGRTALHWALQLEDNAVVQVLLETGRVDLNVKSMEGDTPLHYACQLDDVDNIEPLLKAGADVNMKNNSDETPLSVALKEDINTLKRIRLFLQHGAFFEDSDYMVVYKHEKLKESVLKDVDICTQSIVNKFINKSLPALYKNPYFAKKLPSLDKFILTKQQTEEIKDCVVSEIEKCTYCNVVKAQPIVLTLMCVQTLISVQIAMKRPASPNFNNANLPIKKMCPN